LRAGDPDDGRVPVLRHDLCADGRRSGNRDGNDYHLHLRAGVPVAADRQGERSGRVDSAVRRRVGGDNDPGRLSARKRGILMRPRWRSQGPLFLLLAAFTAINLTPVIWGFLTSIKQPVDAFAVPPRFIFDPTSEFHWQVWVEKGFWHFLFNSAVISI